MYVCCSEQDLYLLKWEKVSKIHCPKQNFKIVFILFKIISELEKIKQDDVDLEGKLNPMKTEILFSFSHQ